MSKIEQSKFITRLIVSLRVLIIITLLLFPFSNRAQLAFPKKSQFSFELKSKVIDPGLPAYQSGLIQVDEDLMSFILPHGYSATSDRKKRQVLFVSKDTGSTFIFRFLTKSDLKKIPLEKRYEGIKVNAKKKVESYSDVKFNFLGKPATSIQYFLSNKNTGDRITVFHSIFPFGGSGCELLVTSPEIDFVRARRELDLLLMTASLGDSKNPPIIPELDSSI